MAKNNTIILASLGIVLVGGIAYYFITRNKKEEEAASTPAPYKPATLPPATSTKSSILDDIKKNKDPLIYRGKVVALAAALKLGLQFAITYKVAEQLKEFYYLLNKTPKSNPLLYGDVNESTIDYYLLDMALHFKTRSQLKAI